MNSRIICVALVALASTSMHGQSVRISEHASAEQALRASRPSLAWRHEQSIDVDCNGRRDEVFTAQDATQYYVAAVAPRKAGKPKISVLQFQLSGSSQDSFCGPPEPLRPESLNYDPGEDLGYTPEGFRRSDRCKGLHLIAGECDSFHLYWNYRAGELDWWRL
jgi:hypothetical protein